MRKNIFNIRSIILVFLLMSSSIVIGAIFPTQSNNLSDRFYYTVSNNWYTIFNLLALLILVNNIHFEKINVNVRIRSDNHRSHIINSLVLVFKVTMIYLLFSFVLTFLILILLRAKINFNLEFFSIISLYFISNTISYTLINVFLFLVRWLFKSIIYVLFITVIILSILFGLKIILTESAVSFILIIFFPNNLFLDIYHYNISLQCATYIYQVLVYMLIAYFMALHSFKRKIGDVE